MSQNVCPQCGAALDPNATTCKFCGEKIFVQQPQQPQQPQQGGPAFVIQQQAAQPQTVYMTGINPAWPVKNKTVAAVLAIFLGSLGIHKFYLGKTGMGILYLVFCWSGIPALAGLIEGIMYLCSNDENFQLKNHVRLQ